MIFSFINRERGTVSSIAVMTSRVSISRNEVIFNNFLNNSGVYYQAFDNEEYCEYLNFFDNNHWNDWTEPDIDADGDVDDPYPISG